MPVVVETIPLPVIIKELPKPIDLTPQYDELEKKNQVLEKRINEFNSYEVKKNLEFNMKDLELKDLRGKLTKMESSMNKKQLQLDAEQLDFTMRSG